MPIELKKIYIPSEKIISRLIDGTLIIVPIGADFGTIDLDESLYSLEGAGKDIWEQLSTQITVEELVFNLSNKYDALKETITRDVLDLLSDLLEKGLVVELR